MKCQYWKVELIALLHCTVVRENVIGVQLIFVLITQASSGFNASATNLGCCFAQNHRWHWVLHVHIGPEFKICLWEEETKLSSYKIDSHSQVWKCFLFLSFSNNQLAAGWSRNLLSTSVISRGNTTLWSVEEIICKHSMLK